MVNENEVFDRGDACVFLDYEGELLNGIVVKRESPKYYHVRVVDECGVASEKYRRIVTVARMSHAPVEREVHNH